LGYGHLPWVMDTRRSDVECFQSFLKYFIRRILLVDDYSKLIFKKTNIDNKNRSVNSKDQ
jgi:hypothetical protein